MRKVTLFIFIIVIGLCSMQTKPPLSVMAQSCELCPAPPYPGYCESFWEWDDVLCECVQPSSPIVIDLGNDGYNLTDAANGVQFDLAGNGRLRKWSWTQRRSDEAFLTLDRNGDGQITSGKELFGDVTEQPVSEEPNGFLALAVFDRNGDRRIDASDEIYRRLLLWIDSNHDGVSQRSELHSLDWGKVEAIGLDYKLSKRSDRYGNRFKYRALARINGVERLVWDIFFLPGKQGGSQ